ncbi:MAG: SpoIID/LytB domain-containing protein [Chloroflexota bacterium]
MTRSYSAPPRFAASRRSFITTAGALTLGALLVQPRAAAAARADEPSDGSESTIRVLLRQAGGAVEGGVARIVGEGLTLRDAASGRQIVETSEETRIRSDDGLHVQTRDGKWRGPFEGPIVAASERGSRTVKHLSGDESTAYRGRIEARASGNGAVAVINVLPLEDYVQAVIPREMPAAFGTEAIRAQAMAARSYALARRTTSSHRAQGADVCDSTDCQVYGGTAAETQPHTAAARDTAGQVVLRDQRVFLTMFSSACGGHTDSEGSLFSRLGSMPDAVPDGDLPSDLDLGTDDGVAAMMERATDCNCQQSPKYRWTVGWDGESLERSVLAGLRKLAGSSAVAPTLASGDALGELRSLDVTGRSVSGRLRAVQVETTKGTWTVRRDWAIRQILVPTDSRVLSSTLVSLSMDRSAGGRIRQIRAQGAGWGHGAGLCQWGAKGLARKGLSYREIVSFYYPNTEIGSVPG